MAASRSSAGWDAEGRFAFNCVVGNGEASEGRRGVICPIAGAPGAH